jgi:hypothetical protein
MKSLLNLIVIFAACNQSLSKTMSHSTYNYDSDALAVSQKILFSSIVSKNLI